jgi:glutamine amidotransferase
LPALTERPAAGERHPVVIVDCGVGNLFSVRSACEFAGLDATVTSDAGDVYRARAVILPGVGAFGEAMATLRRLGLADALRDVAQSGTPIVGICLGMQLLMSESEEFGPHEGLGIVRGRVVRLSPGSGPSAVKVPHVCWSRLEAVRQSDDPWSDTLLDGLPDGTFMYFVHSFVVQPEDKTIALATSRYGANNFCSVLQQGNVFACQCHPERSGPNGLKVYHNLARLLAAPSAGERQRHVQ